MAPYVVDSGRQSQTKFSRPTPVIPRIVPAVPLALSRAPRSTRPITPEDAGQPPTLTHTAETQEPAVNEKSPEEQDVAGVQTPLTPDSKTSGPSHQEQGNGLVEEASTASVASTPEEKQDTRGNIEGIVATTQSEIVQPAPKLDPANKPIKELPPPFYPAEALSTPTSATSSSIPAFQPPTSHISVHNPRPSANSIVFGGLPDSSNTSPAPPAGMMPYPPPPPPGFAPTNYAQPQFFAPSHSQHLSDPNAHVLYSGLAMPPPDAYGYRRDHPMQPWYPPSNHLQYAVPHSEIFSPRNGHGHLNGNLHASRSPSQASTRTQDGESRQSSERSAEKGLQLTNDSQGQIIATRSEDSAIEMVDYISSFFAREEFADHVLQIAHPDTGVLFSMPVHSIIIARSPSLAAALQAWKTTPSEGSLKTIQVASRDRFITNFSLTEGIKHLYGVPAPSTAVVIQGLAPFDVDAEDIDPANEARRRMDQALSYIAAGFFLQLPRISIRGSEIAKDLLRWDTVDQLLAFALDGGLNQSWDGIHANPSTQNGSAPSSSPTYDPESTSLLRHAIDFMAHNLPVDFSLNNLAPQLSETPLLPNLVESRPPTHNPRLSKIRFGEVPLEDNARPNFITTRLSSILFSLPISLIDHLFSNQALGDRVGWTLVIETLRAVIEERENRRKKALKSCSRSTTQTVPGDPLLENLYWEERVEPSDQYPSGYHLARTRKSELAAF